jgi:hypothetical protein
LLPFSEKIAPLNSDRQLFRTPQSASASPFNRREMKKAGTNRDERAFFRTPSAFQFIFPQDSNCGSP